MSDPTTAPLIGIILENRTMNLTNGAVDEELKSDDSTLEAYTVVLSVAAHALSMLFGGGSSLAVIAAITTRRNINKYSYTLVLALFLSCCSLNFIWSPMEVVDLIMYHHLHSHPYHGFLVTKSSIYIFLILTLSLVVVLLSIEGVIRLVNKYGRVLRKLWPLLTCLIALFCAVFLTTGFISVCAQFREGSESLYILHESNIRSTFLALISFAFVVVIVTVCLLGLFLVRETIYWEDGRPHFRRKNLKLTIPEFLISQSNACADNDGGFEPSHSGTPSPSTPKLLTVNEPDTTSIKGEDANTISELHSPVAKPMGNRLGINMAQVLGRRRHTICQINDSTSTASTPADPISRAKQYNYVRKFSVDISALQAQLQNPKIFQEAPFQSDIDLTKKPPADSAKTAIPKPLFPLKPLSLRQEEKEDRPVNTDNNRKKEAGSAPVPPPPVIMVSNDEAQPNHGLDVPNATQNYQESFHKETNIHVVSNTVPQKPTSLAFKDEFSSNDEPMPTLESAQSDPSEAESENQKLARLSLLMCLAFLLNMLPVFVTLTLQLSLSPHAFLNILPCTMAISSIQTIVYPHLVACSDDVVHRAVQKLKMRANQLCSCRAYSEGSQSHAEDSSSTSQL
ncbi:hypothetical protein Bpfe_027850 [Biomphalaria pfeifferi]|uniref:Uncharacterized protein n=1 Tax=Biomphalaria pfeifferi TaxID=112525 RepID=A0AAD8AUJ0_BIOPF|nr:hypothetical protein Bpfe_027850 [Biomphalaria pfeifferi]